MTSAERRWYIGGIVMKEYATRNDSKFLKRRLHQEKDDPEGTIHRDPFQRDRDRILHSRAFRRMMHKTQIFNANKGDHYRNRLTHTLEVSQIARSIGKDLGLNDELVEAIALGHDLGHTPFGHAGERAINKYTGHFTHNEQSIRVVTYYGRQGRGLNLTAEVQDAILCHTGEKLPGTLEGAIVRRCDRICYLCSDLDDSIRVGLAGPDKLPGIVAMRLGTQPSQILDILVHNIVECSAGKDKIILDSYYDEAVEEFRDFMFAYVYECPALEKEHQKAEHVIMSLLDMYEKEPQLLPEDVQLNFDRFGKMTAIVDYVAGLTDLSAVRMFNQHFVPKVSE